MGSVGVTMGVLGCVSLLLLGLTCVIQSADARICWEQCNKNSNIVQSVNIEGCRRRSTYPKKQNFRCSGQVGPPCTVKRGDTVHLQVKWNNPGVGDTLCGPALGGHGHTGMPLS